MKDIYNLAMDKLEFDKDKKLEIRNLLCNYKEYTYEKNKRINYGYIACVAAIFVCVMITMWTSQKVAFAAIELMKDSAKETISASKDAMGSVVGEIDRNIIKEVFTFDDCEVEYSHGKGYHEVTIEYEEKEIKDYIEFVEEKIIFLYENEKIDITEKIDDNSFFEFKVSEKYSIYVGGTKENIGIIRAFYIADGGFTTIPCGDIQKYKDSLWHIKVREEIENRANK